MQTLFLDGCAALAAEFDGYVVDLWGTLHDGVTALPGALDCLRALKRRGARIALLSNAPRRAAEVEAQVNGFGIVQGAYDVLHTSGEEAWQALATRADPWYRALGRRCYHLGPPRDDGMLANPGFDRAPDLEDADFILCTGLIDGVTTVEGHAGILARARALDLPLICANADYEVLRGAERELCAGALARHYETALGGVVRWHGKPGASVLRECLARLGVGEAARAVVIGDTLRTDIACARAGGAKAALVTGGVHARELGIAFGQRPPRARIDALFAREGLRPDYVLPAVRW